MLYASIYQKFVKFILKDGFNLGMERDKGNKLKSMNAVKENKNVP